MRAGVVSAALFLTIALPAMAQVSPASCPRPASTMLRPAPSQQLRAARETERQACAADMAQFCGDVQPGCGRPMRCLGSHAGQLSSGCTNAVQQLRATVRAEPR
jgi:hypothetical protein